MSYQNALIAAKQMALSAYAAAILLQLLDKGNVSNIELMESLVLNGKTDRANNSAILRRLTKKGLIAAFYQKPEDGGRTCLHYNLTSVGRDRAYRVKERIQKLDCMAEHE